MNDNRPEATPREAQPDREELEMKRPLTPFVFPRVGAAADKPEGKGKKPISLGMFIKPRIAPPNFILSVAVSFLRMALVFVLVLATAGVGLVIGIAKAYMETAPQLVKREALRDQDQTSFVYDRNDVLITDWRDLEHRIWARIDEIPMRLQLAFIAQEDTRFRVHNGIDIKRIAGAFLGNLAGDNESGGSTITQQVVKNLMLGSENSYKRKIQEAKLAMELDKEADKDTILETYLNTIQLGYSNYGVKTAAKYYFGRDSLDELTLRECACLAALTKNPGLRNPRRNYYVNNPPTPEYTDEITDSVLDKMYAQNFITLAEKNAAQAEKLNVVENPVSSVLYPNAHAVEFALQDAAALLREKDGAADTVANRAKYAAELRKGGYHIKTTIDTALQDICENEVYNFDDYPTMLESRYSKKTLQTENGVMQLDMPQAAFVLFDFVEGEYRAIVGSRNAPITKQSLNRAAIPRPVGSTIKPLTVYTAALELGLSPSAPTLNIPARIKGWDDGKDGKGYPENYGGDLSHVGLVPMRFALLKSLNIVAAHLLMDVVTPAGAVENLERLGVNTNREKMIKTPATLCLGSIEIPMTEMAVAYGTIANQGVYQRPLAVTKILLSDGTVYLDAKADQQSGKRIALKPGTAFMMTDMLINACKEGMNGTGEAASYHMNMPVAGKTGTNTNAKSVSFSGYTPYYSGSLWVGHDDDHELGRTAKSKKTPTGGSGAAVLWNRIMRKVHEGLEVRENIIEPNLAALGLVQTDICTMSGMRASANCPSDDIVVDYYNVSLANTASSSECTLHRKVLVCTDSYMQPTSYCPHTSEMSLLFIPENNPLNGVDLDVLREYVRGVRKMNLESDGYTLDLGYCTEHTEYWAERQRERREERRYSDDNDDSSSGGGNYIDWPWNDSGSDTGTFTTDDGRVLPRGGVFYEDPPDSNVTEVPDAG